MKLIAYKWLIHMILIKFNLWIETERLCKVGTAERLWKSTWSSFAIKALFFSPHFFRSIPSTIVIKGNKYIVQH
ncbi:hypothetical protein RCL_jg24114.t1 [Rhizophagus clarus]|uniref:Uncharacterized protein n=1 Tax=Rhizophagus clarus TaxID=94130 RepID=A0A8H3LAM3_9GLOM|nr:hypothetical protein RCL_jg24114.t1 [Rhizophagus clarus]